MASSAILIIHARVSFSKSIKITRVRRTSAIFEVFQNPRVLVLSKFHERPSYYVIIIYIKMLETIVVLTYVYSKPSSTDKVFLLCYYNITLYNAITA